MRIESATTNGTATASKANIGASKDENQDFMKLLIVQLQNQNPLDPMEPREFMAQLAQLQTVAELTSVKGEIQKLAANQQWLGPLYLLGREATWRDAGGQIQTGQVEEVRMRAGAAQMVVDGQVVEWMALDSVR